MKIRRFEHINESKAKPIDEKKLIEYATGIEIVCNGEYGVTYYNEEENHIFICIGDSNPFDEEFLEMFIKEAIAKNWKDQDNIKIEIENEAMPCAIDSEEAKKWKVVKKGKLVNYGN
jgi:hypothetical protein